MSRPIALHGPNCLATCVTTPDNHALTKNPSMTAGHDILVIGGSSGSLPPLRAILPTLSPDLPVSIFVTLHLAASIRSATQMLSQSSAFPVVSPSDGEVWSERTLYVAPGNEHLMFDTGGVLRVLHGPRENGARPSIDALFRSAAVHFGPRVVGVLLSGHLYDGAAGLTAIERCGGISIVQDPGDAIEPELPNSALATARVTHCLPAAEIGKKLIELVRSPRAQAAAIPAELRAEARLAITVGRGAGALTPAGKPSALTCPACDGPLFEVEQPGSARFRCEVGHAYNPDALLVEHTGVVERALWIALRTLQERAVLLEKMTDEARRRGFPSTAQGYEDRRLELEEHVRTIRDAIDLTTDDLPPPIAPVAPDGPVTR